MKTDLSFCKTGNKNVQLVLQHCWKTSWIAILRVLPPTFKPVNNLICYKTGFLWVVERAPSLFNLFCTSVAGQVAWCLLPVLPYFNSIVKVILLTLGFPNSFLYFLHPSSVPFALVVLAGDWTWKRRRACFCYLDYLINTQSLFIFIVLSAVFWAVGC